MPSRGGIAQRSQARSEARCSTSAPRRLRVFLVWAPIEQGSTDKLS